MCQEATPRTQQLHAGLRVFVCLIVSLCLPSLSLPLPLFPTLALQHETYQVQESYFTRILADVIVPEAAPPIRYPSLRMIIIANVMQMMTYCCLYDHDLHKSVKSGLGRSKMEGGRKHKS